MGAVLPMHVIGVAQQKEFVALLSQLQQSMCTVGGEFREQCVPCRHHFFIGGSGGCHLSDFLAEPMRVDQPKFDTVEQVFCAVVYDVLRHWFTAQPVESLYAALSI
jgi:hypothetical protein